ncbi:hemophore-related protein [Mycobacterium sp. C3-094]
MTSTDTVRRGLFGVFAGGLLTFGAVAIIAPVARAEPAPGPVFTSDCSAASVAGTVSTAAASEGAYLTANPQTNEALSTMSAQPQPEAQQAYVTYLKDNPQVQRQLEAIYEPVGSLKQRCGITVTPTPVAQAVWTVQTPQLPSAPEPDNAGDSEAPTA